jgi:hypothetical protein
MTPLDPKKDAVLRDATVLIADGSAGVRTFGPKFELVGCEVHLRCSTGGLSFVHSVIRDCVLLADLPVKQVDFTGVAFTNCKFVGRFVECDFGRKTTPTDYGGHLVACDFTAAVLDNCRVFDSDLSDSRFPERWPQVAVRGSYAKAAAELLKEAQSIDEKVFLKVLSDSPPGEVAQFVHAPSLAKELSMTEQQLQAFLATLPFAAWEP